MVLATKCMVLDYQIHCFGDQIHGFGDQMHGFGYQTRGFADGVAIQTGDGLFRVSVRPPRDAPPPTRSNAFCLGLYGSQVFYLVVHWYALILRGLHKVLHAFFILLTVHGCARITWCCTELHVSCNLHSAHVTLAPATRIA